MGGAVSQGCFGRDTKEPIPGAGGMDFAGGARAAAAKHKSKTHVRTSSTPVEHMVVSEVCKACLIKQMEVSVRLVYEDNTVLY